MRSQSCLAVIFSVVLSCIVAFALHSLYAAGAFAIGIRSGGRRR